MVSFCVSVVVPIRISPAQICRLSIAKNKSLVFVKFNGPGVVTSYVASLLIALNFFVSLLIRMYRSSVSIVIWFISITMAIHRSWCARSIRMNRNSSNRLPAFGFGFRLAGERFPPTIYYKIYTNRPIQDLCANAPRDYTRPYLRLKSAVDSNNKLNRFPQQGLWLTGMIFCKRSVSDQVGWYRRIENNGWRPVAYTHLLQANVDRYFGGHDEEKNLSFSHSKVWRRYFSLPRICEGIDHPVCLLLSRCSDDKTLNTNESRRNCNGCRKCSILCRPDARSKTIRRLLFSRYKTGMLNVEKNNEIRGNENENWNVLDWSMKRHPASWEFTKSSVRKPSKIGKWMNYSNGHTIWTMTNIWSIGEPLALVLPPTFCTVRIRARENAAQFEWYEKKGCCASRS